MAAKGLTLARKVQSKWNRAPPLPPILRLNAAFEQIPVSSFPILPLGHVIEVRSDASLHEALETLSRHSIFSAPVLDVQAPRDASWMENYLGMVDFAGIIHWLLYQSDIARSRMAEELEGSTNTEGGSEGTVSSGHGSLPDPDAGGLQNESPAATRFGCPRSEAPGAITGDSFVTFVSSEAYKEAKVTDISASFRWAPFISVQPTDSLLTVLILLSKYRMKSLPVVESGKGAIVNFITQVDVIHMLHQCTGLSWFDKLGKSTLQHCGLPTVRGADVYYVDEDTHVLLAFDMMSKHGVGGVPVVARGSKKVIGNIGSSYVRFLLKNPEIFKDNSSLTSGKFLEAVKEHMQQQEIHSPMLRPPLTCTVNETLQATIAKIDDSRVHRIYVIGNNKDLVGVITLRDIISTFVEEPHGYFGDFFDGMLPASPRPDLDVPITIS